MKALALNCVEVVYFPSACVLMPGICDDWKLCLTHVNSLHTWNCLQEDTVTD